MTLCLLLLLVVVAVVVVVLVVLVLRVFEYLFFRIVIWSFIILGEATQIFYKFVHFEDIRNV